MSLCPEQADSEADAFESWLRYGWERRWVGPPVCATCDGVPATSDEIEAADCLHILRLYSDPAEAAALEAEHSPTVWRASNRGWSR